MQYKLLMPSLISHVFFIYLIVSIVFEGFPLFVLHDAQLQKPANAFLQITVWCCIVHLAG